jgi:ketosteroid isomerase-like protein
VSQANLELFERFVAAINTREISGETAQELVAPDLLIECVSIAVSDSTFHGVLGLRKWISDTFAGLDENARYEVEEIIAEGDDFVVARVHFRGHGAGSGLPVTLRLIQALWFHDGRVTRETGYLHRREALAAPGLSE